MKQITKKKKLMSEESLKWGRTIFEKFCVELKEEQTVMWPEPPGKWSKNILLIGDPMRNGSIKMSIHIWPSTLIGAEL